MVTADGLPLVWLARRRGLTGVSQVCGPEMILEICKHGQARGWRHAFFGATPDVLEALTENLAAQFPGLVIVAAISPPFGTCPIEQMDEMVKRLSDCRPDFVWVGLGSPKQELWMARYAGRIQGALCMGVGGAFDMHAGRKPRAPRWMRSVGLEWIWRAFREPFRLIPRYARVVPRFIGRVVVDEFGHWFRRILRFASA